MNYISSPLNYIGGKGKLLPQILPLFPKDIDNFYDIFCGGTTVSLNVNANRIICNDIVDFIITMFNDIKQETVDSAISKIEDIINTYALSKTNEGGFKALRNDYNASKKEWQYLYTLICYSFNDQYRFNGKHQYNSSFGKSRDFNESKRNKLINFIKAIRDKDIVFMSSNFKDFDFTVIRDSDFVYLDPPYLITTGNYNDGKRGFDGWGEQDDILLMNILDELNNRKIKWALSNVLVHKGKTNDTIIKWCKDNEDKYIVHHLDHNYNNCTYTAKSGYSDEVLICNYRI